MHLEMPGSLRWGIKEAPAHHLESGAFAMGSPGSKWMFVSEINASKKIMFDMRNENTHLFTGAHE